MTGRRSAPALWRVRKGGGTIIILATISPVPNDFRWNDRAVKEAIAGSHRMLVNAEPEANLVWMRSWSAAAARSLRQPKGRALVDDLNPEDWRRFRSAVGAAGQQEARYDTLRPAIAAMLLNADWRERAALSNVVLSQQLIGFARRRHVPVHFIRQTALLPTIDEVPAGRPAADDQDVGRRRAAGVGSGRRCGADRGSPSIRARRRERDPRRAGCRWGTSPRGSRRCCRT